MAFNDIFTPVLFELPSNATRPAGSEISPVDGKPYAVQLRPMLSGKAAVARNRAIYKIGGTGTDLSKARADLSIENFPAQTAFGAIDSWNIEIPGTNKARVLTLDNLLELDDFDIEAISAKVQATTTALTNPVVEAEKNALPTNSGPTSTQTEPEVSNNISVFPTQA